MSKLQMHGLNMFNIKTACQQNIKYNLIYHILYYIN